MPPELEIITLRLAYVSKLVSLEPALHRSGVVTQVN